MSIEINEIPCPGARGVFWPALRWLYWGDRVQWYENECDRKSNRSMIRHHRRFHETKRRWPMQHWKMIYLCRWTFSMVEHSLPIGRPFLQILFQTPADCLELVSDPFIIIFFWKMIYCCCNVCLVSCQHCYFNSFMDFSFCVSFRHFWEFFVIILSTLFLDFFQSLVIFCCKSLKIVWGYFYYSLAYFCNFLVTLWVSF